MEGKELLSLLDLVNDLKKEADDFEKAIPQTNTESGEAQFKLKANIYGEIAKRLEERLRELNK